MDQSSAISVENLTFTYEDQSSPVLKGVHAEIKKGEFSILAGPSGAGKSTLCRTLNNIIPVFYRGALSGRRYVAGEWLDQQKIAAIAKKLGMVFQDFEQQLFSTSTLLELSFCLENFGFPVSEMKDRMQMLLQKFGMGHLISREPSSLSGGEKQKLAIASVMAYRPAILVLDEPTTDLDPDGKELVLQVIPELKEWVETIVIVDHETEQFAGADQILLLRDGKIQGNGPPEQILANSKLLQENSMAPLDLVVVQQALGRIPSAEDQLKALPVPARTSSEPIVQIDALSFTYEEQSTPALDRVSFEVRKGEFIGIVGRNGSGKSTLLRHLSGLQLPQTGSVRILGKETTQWNRKALSQTVGLVFQNPDHQIFQASVREEIEFGPRQFGFRKEDTDRLVRLAIETMDLGSVVDRDPVQLSKGERQRVAVASILSSDPQILILDEPTTGLDYRQQKFMMDLLKQHHKNGKTIIIVTHAIKLVGEYCDHAILMENGKLLAEGHPRSLFFGTDYGMKLPALWELSKKLNINALTAEELIEILGTRRH
jgi:energy-coupling factor transport system ATP-binding protein